MITKYLEPCIDLIQYYKTANECNVSLNGNAFMAELSHKESDRQHFYLDLNVNNRSLPGNYDDYYCNPISLRIADRNFIIPEHSCFMTNYCMNCDVVGGVHERVCLKVSCLQTPSFDDRKKKYHRIMIDADGTSLWTMNEIESVWYKAGVSRACGLITVDVKDRGELHVYPFTPPVQKDKKPSRYLVCDILFECTWKEAMDLYYNVAVSLSLFTKTILMDCLYGFSYDDESMADSFEFRLQTLPPTSFGQYDIFVFNIHPVYDYITKKANSEIAYAASQMEISNCDGESCVNSSFISPLRQKFFSSYFNTLLSNKDLQRAASIMVDASTFALEYQGTMYSIALQTITKALHLDFPKPCEDDKFGFIKYLLDVMITGIQKTNFISCDTARIFKNSLGRMNTPTNIDTLCLPFEHYGYRLSDYEKKTIKARNPFMHGSLPCKLTDMDKAYSEIWNICTILHKLCFILLLKNAGFSGMILNNCVLNKIKESIEAKEPIFISI